MEKAQLLAQPFYYIFVMIVIALILIFGVRVITKLIETQEQAKFLQFKTDFQNAVDNVYSKNPGTKLSHNLLLPKDAKQVCFKNLNTYSEVSGDSKYFQNFNVDNLVPINANSCIKAKNQKLNFVLENKVLNQKTIVEIYESTI